MNEQTILQYSKELTLSYLKQINAKITESDGIYSISLSSEFSKLFGGDSRRITFDPEVASTHSCELAVPGSKFLSIILNEIRKQAPVVCGTVEKNIENPSGFINKLDAHNCNIILASTKEAKKNAVRFYFNITLKSIKSVSLIRCIDVRLDNLDLLNLPAKITLTQNDNRGDSTNQQVDYAYTKAIQNLEIEMEPLAYKYDDLTKINKQRDIESIDQLYNKRISEIKQDLSHYKSTLKDIGRKIKSARSNETMTKYVQQKKKTEERLDKDEEKAIEQIVELNTQKDNLIIETEKRYRPVIEFSLIAAQLYAFSSTDCVISLKNDLTEKQIKAEFIDPSTSFVVKCELCNNNMNTIHLCTNSHASCERCSLHCFNCQKDFCLKCEANLLPCYICKEGLCLQCSSKCKFCSEISCVSHSMICKHCSEVTCFFCTERCDYCSNKFCGRSFSRCISCSKRLCINDTSSCTICDRHFCPDHISTCSICDKLNCRGDTAFCKMCHQQYSVNCVVNDICRTCGSLATVDKNNETVKEIILMYNKLDKYKKWEMSSNHKYVIFRIKKFLDSRLLVIDKENKRIIETIKIGIF